jgi:hypothetical protein
MLGSSMEGDILYEDDHPLFKRLPSGVSLHRIFRFPLTSNPSPYRRPTTLKGWTWNAAHPELLVRISRMMVAR